MLGRVWQVADGIPNRGTDRQAVTREHRQASRSAMHWNHRGARGGRGRNSVLDSDDPDALSSLRDPEVCSVEVPDLWGPVSGCREALER